MTAVLDAVGDAGTAASGEPTASWPARVGAFAVDVLAGSAVIATMALLAWSAPRWGWTWWVFVGLAAVTFVAMAVNRVMAPTITGFSLGRALAGIAVRNRAGEPVGLARLAVRDVAHLLDTAALFLGWLWPLWDRRRRTFADLLLRTEVRVVDKPAHDVRRPIAVALLAAALVCGAAVGLGYWAVYEQDRTADRARAEIAGAGPRIVERMLSFSADSVTQDFARAQSLATDAYRPQLVAQQETVRNAGATTNEYWTADSAVLSASQDDATMLLALQGQRGTEPEKLKFITATVRAEFQRSADGQWRVANLTVLKKPNMNRGGR